MNGTLADERAVKVCPQCEGEGGYPDGLDEGACHTECTRCGGNGWIVDLAALRAPDREAVADDVRERVARAISLADHKRTPDYYANGFPEDLSDWDLWIADAALSAMPAPDREAAAVEWMAHMNAVVSKAPEPLRELGEYLARVLDEDQWPTAERYLNAAALSAMPAATGEREAVEALTELEAEMSDQYAAWVSDGCDSDEAIRFVFGVGTHLHKIIAAIGAKP